MLVLRLKLNYFQLMRFLRLPVSDVGEKEVAKSKPVVDTADQSAEGLAEAASVPEPTLEEMRDVLLSRISGDAIPAEWLDEVKRRRIHNMKAEILKGGDIEASRVFQAEGAGDESEGRSLLTFKITN